MIFRPRTAPRARRFPRAWPAPAALLSLQAGAQGTAPTPNDDHPTELPRMVVQAQHPEGGAGSAARSSTANGLPQTELDSPLQRLGPATGHSQALGVKAEGGQGQLEAQLASRVGWAAATGQSLYEGRRTRAQGVELSIQAPPATGASRPSCATPATPSAWPACTGTRPSTPRRATAA